VEMTTAHFVVELSTKEGHLDTPANAGYSMTLWIISPILGLPKYPLFQDYPDFSRTL